MFTNTNNINNHTRLESQTDRLQATVQLNQIVQHAKLTSLSFSKIKVEGLRKSLELYREQCVPVLRGPIERTIARLDSEITNLELYGVNALLFTFAYSRTGAESVLEYIGIAVNKVNNCIGHGTFDYTVYTYSYEEPEVVEEHTPEKPETEKQSNPRVEITRKHESGIMAKFANFVGLDSSTKSKTESVEFNREANRKRNHEQSGKRNQESVHKIKRETLKISLNSEKIAALKVCFVNELYNQRNLLLEELGDGKFKVTVVHCSIVHCVL